MGADQKQARSPPAAFCLSNSAGEGASDHQVLQVSGEARRLGMGAELCDHRAQQPLIQATLYRQCQLRPHVSASLGPIRPLHGLLVSRRLQAADVAVLGEAGVHRGSRF